jgi:hypothetical protein
VSRLLSPRRPGPPCPQPGSIPSSFSFGLSASAARLAGLIAIATFALIVLAAFPMFTLAGLAAIHRRIVVRPVLDLAAVLLVSLGGRPVLLLADFAIYVISSVML